jgi:Xaa-Pro aminopeptidase
VRAALDAIGAEALVVTSPSNIRYLSNHVGTAGVLVLTREGADLLVDFRYRESVRVLQASDAACPGLRVVDVPSSYDEALVTCLSQTALSVIAFEAAHVSVSKHEWWRAALAARRPGVSLEPTERIVERARMLKDAFEIALLRDAAVRLDRVMPAALLSVRAGTTEARVAGAIEAAMREAGYERPAFDTIVASGPNSALPHHRAGERTLAAGDLVVLDFGGVLGGYCSDVTRTVSIGAPSREAQRVYAAVHEAQAAAIAAVRPGVDASSVDAAARGALAAHGLDHVFGHGTGHGLGLDVHEDPRIGQPRPESPSATIEPGMVFTIEPGAYLPGFGGVRIEDDVLVTATGCEVLTRIPRELVSLS